ncbi:hypothetical protein EFK50_19975 [Nocardioides marmoriginsengisoli]|uniref:Uncharacterized protein n=1 Tax=Nocardioides marmoriginsengisoli TaxID=661483 RepID=A0A3N0CAV1_9ACTN|nr:hypothetical protein [Nocardioides marmoriginsengisoli]RNL60594.1 hypothetical protein EFK50_19975 [Nocardioides marmoriginsengisoli]
MTVSSKHKHARRRAPARLPGTPVRVLVAVVAVAGAALLLRLVLGGEDAADDGQTPVGAALTTVGNTWKTAAGDSYRLTITPINEPVNVGSNDGCVPAPRAGRTNLRFTVRIDNEGAAPAQVPRLEFGANVTAAGAVSPGLTFTKASKAIAITPQRKARDCAAAARVNKGDDEIAPASAAIYTGLIGGIKTPVGAGLSLIVRYEYADPGGPGGSSTKDLVARFPKVAG